MTIHVSAETAKKARRRALRKKGSPMPASPPLLAEADGVFFLTLAKGDRTSVAYTIERLIDMLDAMEPDPDLEPSIGGFLMGGTAHDEREADYEGSGPDAGVTSDDEPSLGWCGHSRSQYGFREDVELDHADEEPSLASPERHLSPYCYGLDGSQSHWAEGGKDEREEENENGGDIQDEPHDDGQTSGPDFESSLGWQNEGSQASLSRAEPGTWAVEDGEQDICDEPHDAEGESGIADRDGLDWFVSTSGTSPRRRMVKNPTINPALYPDRFTMLAEGVCLEPEIGDGQRLMVDKTRPVAPGDIVCIVRKPDTVAPGDHRIKVKKLLAPRPDCVIVQMLNPPMTLAYPMKDIEAVWFCEPAPADYVPGPLVKDADILAERARRQRGGTVIREVALPTIGGAPQLRASDFDRLPWASASEH